MAPTNAMDLVEEFLELGRKVFWLAVGNTYLMNLPSGWTYQWVSQVSVSTLVAFFEIIKRRFPRRLIPYLWQHSLQHSIWYDSAFVPYILTPIITLLNWGPIYWIYCGWSTRRTIEMDLGTFWRWVDRQSWRKMLPKPKGCFISISMFMITVTPLLNCILCQVLLQVLPSDLLIRYVSKGHYR